MALRVPLLICVSLAGVSACGTDATDATPGADASTADTGGADAGTSADTGSGWDADTAFGALLVDDDNDGACDAGETVLNVFANHPFSDDEATVIDLDTGAGRPDPGTCEDGDGLAEWDAGRPGSAPESAPRVLAMTGGFARSPRRG